MQRRGTEILRACGTLIREAQFCLAQWCSATPFASRRASCTLSKSDTNQQTFMLRHSVFSNQLVDTTPITQYSLPVYQSTEHVSTQLNCPIAGLSCRTSTSTLSSSIKVLAYSLADEPLTVFTCITHGRDCVKLVWILGFKFSRFYPFTSQPRQTKREYFNHTN